MSQMQKQAAKNIIIVSNLIKQNTDKENLERKK